MVILEKTHIPKVWMFSGVTHCNTVLVIPVQPLNKIHYTITEPYFIKPPIPLTYTIQYHISYHTMTYLYQIVPWHTVHITTYQSKSHHTGTIPYIYHRIPNYIHSSIIPNHYLTVMTVPPTIFQDLMKAVYRRLKAAIPVAKPWRGLMVTTMD